MYAYRLPNAMGGYDGTPKMFADAVYIYICYVLGVDNISMHMYVIVYIYTCAYLYYPMPWEDTMNTDVRGCGSYFYLFI